jgi:hypothetical protein
MPKAERSRNPLAGEESKVRLIPMQSGKTATTTDPPRGIRNTFMIREPPSVLILYYTM